MRFRDVVGQDEIKAKLVSSVKNDKVTHANIFIGPEGTGGLPLALAFAQFLNCTNRTENDSCGECPSCTKMQKLIHPDVYFTFPTISTGGVSKPISTDFIKEWRKALLENPYVTYIEWLDHLKAENKQGNITIAECHEIIKHLSLKSYEGGKKIQIIWLAEFLGKNGNSLLKIIEEPTPNTFFIFISENKNLILNTILSRTQITLLPPLNDVSISKSLIENFHIDEEESKNIAHLANGNYSEALRIYRVGQNNHAESFISWMRLCYTFKTLDINKWLTTHTSNGREYLKDFLKYGIRIIREAYLLGNDLESISHLGKTEQEFAIKFSPFINSSNILEIYNLLNKAHYHIERNASPKIIFFNLSLQIYKLLRNN